MNKQLNSPSGMQSGDVLAQALEVKGLTRYFGGRPIINKLDLKLPPASLAGLLGPNGAGKTTLLKLLAGLITPDGGEIRLAGYDLHLREAQARGQLAYVPDTPNFYSELTVIEHLQLMALANKATVNFEARAEQLLRHFNLWDARNSFPFTLSRGMTQKLALCYAFIKPSRVMLLDEPGGTLDTVSVKRLYELLDQYRAEGGLAILSSHQWEPLQQLCDFFVLMDGGEILAAGDLPFLREMAGLPEEASLREVYLAFMYDDEDAVDDPEEKAAVSGQAE